MIVMSLCSEVIYETNFLQEGLGLGLSQRLGWNVLQHLGMCSPKGQGQKSPWAVSSEPPVGAARVKTQPEFSFFHSLCSSPRVCASLWSCLCFFIKQKKSSNKPWAGCGVLGAITEQFSDLFQHQQRSLTLPGPSALCPGQFLLLNPHPRQSLANVHLQWGWRGPIWWPRCSKMSSRQQLLLKWINSS